MLIDLKSSTWTYKSILSVSLFVSDTFLEDVKKLTYFWVAVLATTTLGRHVERLKIVIMARGG